MTGYLELGECTLLSPLSGVTAGIRPKLPPQSALSYRNGNMIAKWVRNLLIKDAGKRMQFVRRKQLARPSVENLEGRRLLAFTSPMTFATGSIQRA